MAWSCLLNRVVLTLNEEWSHTQKNPVKQPVESLLITGLDIAKSDKDYIFSDFFWCSSKSDQGAQITNCMSSQSVLGPIHGPGGPSTQPPTTLVI